jgi:transposase InsO family protein
VATIRSNVRWCSDVLEFTCWNGEIVGVAFALDCHDREVIGWTVTTAGISREMIRDLIVDCIERHFGVLPAPHRVAVALRQRLNLRRLQDDRHSSSRSISNHASHRSPESNGTAEAFVKTFKCDYVRANPIPDAATALARIELWMEDFNTMHPHSRLGYRFTAGVYQRPV